MPASTEPNSGIKYGWDLGESGWNLEMDSNLKKIGRVMQLSVIDRDLTAPPASPADGDRYIIAAGATGAWAGHDNKVAVWEAAASAWIVYAPFKGWVGYVEDEDVAVRYDGTAWQSYSLANADTVDGKHAADFYQPSNILGTVSQSGGIPTGAVIERGSNANGEYVKFADGTMICTRTKTYPAVTVSTTNYTILDNDSANLQFPASFIATPYVAAAYLSGWGGEMVPTLEGADNMHWGGFLFLVKLIEADRTVTPTVKLVAIGRWF